MAEFAPDGAWKEGPGYWNYATSYNVVFLAGLQTALGTDFGLSQIGAFEKTGLFPIYLTGPLGRTFNYADGGDHAIFAPQMFWLARQFNQPVFAWYERRVTTPSALDLLWYDRRAPTRKPPVCRWTSIFAEPRSPCCAAIGTTHRRCLSASRRATTKPTIATSTWAALCSMPRVCAGLWIWVRTITTCRAISAGQRWNYYRLRAEGQNTLVINPGARARPGPGGQHADDSL